MARRKVVTVKGNATVKTTTWKSILGAKAFGTGFNDVKRGRPFDDSIPVHEQWHYERGRLFGVVYHGKIKEGRRVIPAAIYAIAEAFRAKAVL